MPLHKAVTVMTWLINVISLPLISLSWPFSLFSFSLLSTSLCARARRMWLTIQKPRISEGSSNWLAFGQPAFQWLSGYPVQTSMLYRLKSVAETQKGKKSTQIQIKFGDNYKDKIYVLQIGWLYYRSCMAW